MRLTTAFVCAAALAGVVGLCFTDVQASSHREAPLISQDPYADNTDVYSFVSPRNGTVNFILTNRSSTLIPALSTFLPDRRSSGFGPDVREPGGNLRHSIPVQANQTYYIQVWAQGNTTGDYSFIIE